MSRVLSLVKNLKLKYNLKNSSIPNPEFYNHYKTSWREYIKYDFRYRIKIAKLIRNKAKKNGITRHTFIEKRIKIYYVRFADNFLLGFEADKKITKKFTNKIVKFIKSDLLLACHDCGERSTVVIFNKNDVKVNCETKKVLSNTKDSIQLLIRFFRRTIRKANNRLDWKYSRTYFTSI